MPRATGPNEHELRRAQLTANIGGRLRRVCGHLTEEQFAALVRDIVDVTMKFEQREHRSPFDSVEPPRLTE